MKNLSVIKRYARALYETAVTTKASELLRKDMQVLETLFAEAPEIQELCARASDPDSSHTSGILVETAFLPYLSDMTGSAVKLMEKNGRLAVLPYLPRVIQEFFDEDEGISAVTVESASELDDSTKEEITEKLKKRIEKRLKIDWRIRPLLMGGITVQWDNLFLDMSLRGRFDSLKRQLRGIQDER